MGLQTVKPPATQRKSKYDYSDEDATEALRMLTDEESDAPGDGPFDTSGKARAASNALIAAVARVDKDAEVGARVWDAGDGAHWFALKLGKREYHGRKDGAKNGAGTAAKGKGKNRK